MEPQSEQTSEQPNFLDTLPEDVRNEASLENIQDVGQLAKGYVSAQRMVGADKIAMVGTALLITIIIHFGMGRVGVAISLPEGAMSMVLIGPVRVLRTNMVQYI